MSKKKRSDHEPNDPMQNTENEPATPVPNYVACVDEDVIDESVPSRDILIEQVVGKVQSMRIIARVKLLERLFDGMGKAKRLVLCNIMETQSSVTDPVESVRRLTDRVLHETTGYDSLRTMLRHDPIMLETLAEWLGLASPGE